MATGNNYLTTYYAKRIIGDDASATASSALLETGSRTVESGETIDTWIFHDTNLNTTYGIKHENGTNKYLKIYGNDVVGWYINMDTGDIYVLGKVGIGYDPETNGNTYKLYVNGTSYFNGQITGAGGIILPWIELSSATPYIDWHFGSSTADYTSRLIESSSGYLQFTGKVGIGGENTSYTLYVNGTTWHTGHIYLAAAKHIYMSYNSTNYNILHNHNNGNVSLNAASAGLYMAYQNTTFVNWMNGRMELRDGCLSLFPNNGSYREGIRIHATGSWSDITLCGNDNTGNSGTSANSWFIGNNNGNFYIARNGSSTGTSLFGCVSNIWRLYTSADMPEGAANIASACAGAHYMTFYRNAILIPYQMDNTNDGGFFRVRGTSESTCIAEIGTWDDSGSGETIQFNYYPTTSQVTPTYSITVPKKSGTIALTNDLTWANIANKPATATRWPSWSEVTSKPSTFAPSSHTHPVSQVTWANGQNLSCTGGGEWSVDMNGDGYWHVWSVAQSRSTLICYNSNSYVAVPIHLYVGGYNNTSYGLSASSIACNGSIAISQNNATGGGIIFADDGDIVDLNDGYCSMRFSSGVRIFSGNRGGSAQIRLGSNGECEAKTLRSTSYAYLNGTVYVNTNVWGWSGGAHLEVNTNGQAALWTGGNYRVVVQNDGNFVLYNPSGSARWHTNTASTYLIKTNIRPITNDTFNRFRRLNVVSFRYKPEIGMEDTSEHYGLIAEEVLPIFPNLVRVPENYNPANFSLSKKFNQPMLQLKYEKLIPLLVKIVQLQWDEIDKLKNQIQQLTNRLSTI